MSYINDLGKLYSESWGPSSPNLPGDGRSRMPPQETKDSIRMKGIFGAGDSPSNMAAVSQASGQNPFEQEEDEMISKNTVLKIIDHYMADLDSKNRLDQSGVAALGYVKKNIKLL